MAPRVEKKEPHPYAGSLVKRWNDRAMYADELVIDACEHHDGDNVVSVTMLAEDGNAFGHIHLPEDSAIVLYRLLGELILGLSGGRAS